MPSRRDGSWVLHTPHLFGRAPVTGFGGTLLRGLLLGIAGGAIGLVAFGLSRVGGELLSAMFFIIAVFMVPLTAGVVIAAVLVASQEREKAPRMLRAKPGEQVRCGLCRRTMAQVGFLWVCPVCDGAGVED